MKKQFIKTILLSSAFALLLTACMKEEKRDAISASTSNSSTPTAAISGMRAEYANAKMHNDSLILWNHHMDSCMNNMMGCTHNMMMMDSTHCIAMMHHSDSIYHHCDSIMMNHHNTCHSNMSNCCNSSGGGMMSGGGVMGGNNTTMDCKINGNDCMAMIDSLHVHHNQYHPH